MPVTRKLIQSTAQHWCHTDFVPHTATFLPFSLAVSLVVKVISGRVFVLRSSDNFRPRVLSTQPYEYFCQYLVLNMDSSMQRFGALPSINGSYFMPSDSFHSNLPILENTSINTPSSKPISNKAPRGKKRLDARRHNYGYGPVADRETHQLPAQVARRNERERNRVKQVNLGFATLREHVRLPNGSKNKKMSKVETLKGALDYIRRLQNMLGDMDPQSHSADHAPSKEPASSTTSTSERSPDDATFSSHLATHQPCFASLDMLDSFFDSDSDSPDSSMTCEFLKTEDDYPWI